MNLVLDAGHGASSTGAVANGIVEKDYVLRLAKDVRMAVANIGWPIPTVLTRVSDRKMGLRQRAQISANEGADLVISLHCNAWRPSARGLMAFYWPGNTLGREVANQIQRSAPAALASRSGRPAAASSLAWPRVRNVLRYHKATAVLVEVGFITNPHDAAALRDQAVQRELIACILGGISRAYTLRQRRRSS